MKHSKALHIKPNRSPSERVYFNTGTKDLDEAKVIASELERFLAERQHQKTNT